MTPTSNTFSYGKCWNFGKLIPTEFKGTWKELISSHEWIEFKTRRGLTDNQIYYIKRGFNGKPFEDDTERSKENSDILDDELFPFGAHKGKKFAEIPDRYYSWLLEQSWLDKWPTVAVYAKRRQEKINDNKASAEEIEEFMKFKV